MTKALSSDEKALRSYERAVLTVQMSMEQILALHVVNEDKEAKYCVLCFENWPCRTQKFAQEGLTKMKGQLPR